MSLRIIVELGISGMSQMCEHRAGLKFSLNYLTDWTRLNVLSLCIALAVYSQADYAQAQSNTAFTDAYGAMIGPGALPRARGRDFFVSQQSNMADRGSTNAGVNPRGNVDVNPPGFIGDNPFGNSTIPNP